MTPLTRNIKRLPILVAKASTGVGTSQIVADYANVAIALATSGSANFTVKIQGSLQAADNPPDFSAAASATNQWTYIDSFDMENGTSIDGSTGYGSAGTDVVQSIKINTNSIIHLNVSVTAWVAGSITATAVCFSNQ